MSEEQAHQFDEWVRDRLAGWSTAEIRALDRWLVHESHFEFVAPVRQAWMEREPAA